MPPSSRVGGLAFLGQPPCCSVCTVRGGTSPWSRFQSNGLPCPLRLTLAPLPLTHGPEFLLFFSPYTHAHTHTHTHTHAHAEQCSKAELGHLGSLQTTWCSVSLAPPGLHGVNGHVWACVAARGPQTAVLWVREALQPPAHCPGGYRREWLWSQCGGLGFCGRGEPGSLEDTYVFAGSQNWTLVVNVSTDHTHHFGFGKFSEKHPGLQIAPLLRPPPWSP